MTASPLGGKRVLVTGGHGFLGQHLLPRIQAACGSAPAAPRHWEFDLTDRAAVKAMLAKHRPEVVVHLAARVGGIGANQRNPGLYFHDNLAMGLHLLEEARLQGVGKVVLLGTICSYPKHCPVPFREEDLWNGFPEETNAPYGVAKKALLSMAQAYRAQYGLNAVMVLPVNLYGPGDHFDLEDSHVIPALVRKMVEAVDAGADEVEVWGSGKPTREFLYVEDCADGIVRAAESLETSDPVNLGAGFEISIADLAALVARTAGFKGRLRFDPARPDGQPRRSLDTSRAERLLGWRAGTPLEDGLKRTVDWYRDNRART
jgi:GDP-L-fucose synthase